MSPQQMDNKQKTENLEALISKISFEIVNEEILDETEINKLLGVLSSNGVYAMWVYALDKFGVKFSEDCQMLKEEKLFKLLSKIAELDKFISKTINFEQLAIEMCNLTKGINNLKQEIKGLNDEIKKLEKEKNRDELKRRKKELKRKVEDKKEKEKERNNKLIEYFINIANDIHKLLFLKQLLEKTLIYARYHAKALQDGE